FERQMRRGRSPLRICSIKYKAPHGRVASTRSAVPVGPGLEAVLSMDTPATLRLLAPTNNTRRDRFTQLVKDLFLALGYDDLTLDTPKPGREIDVQGTHRFEPRRLVAECKAHNDKMGGAEVNKFRGVVSIERDQDERTPVAGYFVSLSGFRG